MVKEISREKVKAMERLIFLVRASKNITSDKEKQEIKMGFKDSAESLDKLGIPMWKQNYIVMLAEETDWYMSKIIKYVYFLKKPTDFKRGYP